jgi:hypothetical protein
MTQGAKAGKRDAAAVVAGRALLPPFKPMRWAEKLLKLQRRDPDEFLRRTSEGTRNSLLHYLKWKATVKKEGVG